MVTVLQTSINPFDLNLIPDNWIPKIEFKGFEFELKKNGKLFADSGYRFQTSIFSIGIMVVVFIVEFAALCVMYMVILTCSKVCC